MNIIKVDTIDSTNTFLKEGLRQKSIKESTCIWAQNQTQGRGQWGSLWSSEANKNLTFSVFVPVSEAIQQKPFVLNMLVALSVQKVLNDFKLPQLKIKWPNDILSANKKIGGILIETSYQNGVLAEAVIGIGLNLNQQNFEGLPKASSIKNILGVEIDRESLLLQILNQLETSFEKHKAHNFKALKNSFEAVLFRNKKPSTFCFNGIDFVGVIQGITDEGLLQVLEEDNQINQYDLKEIELKY